MTDAIIPLRSFTDEEAQAWLRLHSGTQLTVSEIARMWRWERTRASRRLKAWAEAGQIVREPGTDGRMVITVVVLPVVVRDARVLAPCADPVHTLAHAAQPLNGHEKWPVDEGAGVQGVQGVGVQGVQGVRLGGTDGVAAYFSVSGMTEIFRGAPVAVMALAGTMEIGKLALAGWLSAHWRMSGWMLRLALVALVVGLALINAVGVFGRLVEAHVGVAAAGISSVLERMGALDARVAEQEHVVADIDRRISQIDQAIEEATRRGRAVGAMMLAGEQRGIRDGLVATRQKEADVMVELRARHAVLDGERQRVEASTGPVRYIAMMAGVETETAVRWLIADRGVL